MLFFVVFIGGGLLLQSCSNDNYLDALNGGNTPTKEPVPEVKVPTWEVEIYDGRKWQTDKEPRMDWDSTFYDMNGKQIKVAGQVIAKEL